MSQAQVPPKKRSPRGQALKDTTIRLTDLQRETLALVGHGWVRDRLDEYRRAFLQPHGLPPGAGAARPRHGRPSKRQYNDAELKVTPLSLSADQLGALKFLGPQWVRDRLDEYQALRDRAAELRVEAKKKPAPP